MLAAVGRFAYRGRWLVLVTWLMVLVAGAVFGTSVFDRLDAADTRDDVESAVAAHRLDGLGGTGPDVVVLIDGAPVTDPGVRAEVAGLASRLRTMPDVDRVVDAVSTQPPGLTATDGRAQLVVVYLRPGLSTSDTKETIDDIRDQAATVSAPRVLVGGRTAALNEFNSSAEEQLARGEAIALPLVLILRKPGGRAQPDDRPMVME